jgi:hypothetical protein
MFSSLHIGTFLLGGAFPALNVRGGSTREPGPPPAKPSHHSAEESLERPTDVSALALFADTGIASAPPAAHNVRRNSERDMDDVIGTTHESTMGESIDDEFLPWEDETLPAWLEPPDTHIDTLTGLEVN